MQVIHLSTSLKTEHPANFSRKLSTVSDNTLITKMFIYFSAFPYRIISVETWVNDALRDYLLCKALEQLLHVWGEVFMQTAERPQHAPDHLQGQTIKLRQLI